MESDSKLNAVLAAIEELTEADLEEMLEFESNISNEFQNIMERNREELSSQFSDRSPHDIPPPSPNEIQNPVENNSVFIHTTEIETIEVSGSTASSTTFGEREDNQDLSFSLSGVDDRKRDGSVKRSFNSSDLTRLEAQLEKEFAELEKMDLEIPSLEESGEAVDTGNKDNEEHEFKRPMNVKSYTNFQKKSFTQVVTKKNVSLNETSSCPIFTDGRRRSSSNSENSDETNAMDYLEVELNVSSSSSSGSNRNSINVPEGTKSPQLPNVVDHNKNINDKQNNNAIEIASSSANRQDITNNTTDPTAIPSTVKQLYDIIKENYSDFSFIYALSAQLCQERIPMGCFVNVKMSLLLSIASIGKNPDIAPIPIIIMGNDPYMANCLITTLADLADRFVGPVDDTKPPSSDGFCNRVWIEADPIQLAKGGVFYVGEWTCMKTQRSEKIFKDIESSRVAVERTTRIYPLQTAIWAHWRAMKYNSKDQQIFNKFVKIFGIPVYMDNKNHESLVDYVLKQASVQMFESTIDELAISADDMRDFLSTVSKRTVDFTAEAVDLLQRYFVASRTERPDCLTKQAFTILKQYAESFAKLALRHEVITIDAIGAIFLCEHFIQNLYGVGIDPPPAMESTDFVGYVDTYIAQFYEWVKSYISKYGAT